MALTVARRNTIAWKYVVAQVKESGLSLQDFGSPNVRQKIRKTAEKLGISFEDALEFARTTLVAASKSK